MTTTEKRSANAGANHVTHRSGPRFVASVIVALLLSSIVVGITRGEPAEAAAPTFGIASSMDQVRPTDSAAGMPATANLVATRNEAESFQIVVQGPATGVSLAGSPFPGAEFTVHRVEYYNATEPSDGEGGTGRWGDALIPETDIIYGENRNAFPFDVPAGENRVIWVDVFVPASMTAGMHSGSFTLTGNGTPTAVPVSLEVLNLDLPTSSLPNAYFFGNSPNDICGAHTGNALCNGDSGQRQLLHSLYTRMALENRVTIANGFGLGHNQPPTTYPAADWESNLEAPLIRGDSTVPAGADYRLPATLSTIAPYAYSGAHCQTTCADAWEAEAGEPGQAFGDRVVWYACDEPNDSAALWQSCATASSATTAAWARPTLVTATIDQHDAHAATAGMPEVNILVPPVNRIDDKVAPYAGNQRADYNTFLTDPDHELWLYTSCLAHGCAGDTFGSPAAYWDGWPGYAIDGPATRQRAMSWMIWRYDATGELYWSATQSLGTAWANAGQFAFGANGDGTLFYPGTTAQIGGTHDIPVESARLKRIRDGREDYEMMRWLAANGKQAEVDSIVSTLFPTAHSTSAAQDGTGPGTLLAARTQLTDLVRQTAPPVTPTTGRIAFASNRSGNYDIYSMNPDGSAVTPLTTHGANDRFPAWSPDGTRIAFTRGDDIWTMDADGSNEVNITADIAPQAQKPVWTLDGTKLVFVYTESNSYTDLWTMNADGTAKTPFWTYATGMFNSYDPTTTADRVIFNLDDDLLYKDLGGPGNGTLVGGATIDEVADYAAATDKLAFSRSSGGPYDIYVTDADGQNPVNITGSAPFGVGSNDLHSSFDPTGASVALASTSGGSDLEIWTVTATGASPQQLTDNNFQDTDPDWGSAPVDTGCTAAPPHGFTDVPAWVDDAVRWIADKGYASGYPDNTYKPDNPITRAQVTRMLYRIAGSPDVTGTPGHGFTDVPAWVDDAVRWIADKGYASGYHDNTYKPDNPITRAQVTRMLYRIAGSPDVTGTPGHGFTDVPAWVDDAVRWIADKGYASGYPDNTYKPDNPITRAQVTRMLYRIDCQP